MPSHSLSITVMSARFALCRLQPRDAIPEWTTNAREFLTISRTPTELSIVADEAAVPSSVEATRGFRALRVEGPLPLEMVGVAASIAGPLADAGISIFPIGTYDTDYILVRDVDLPHAIATLTSVGHIVNST
ncbi:MAG: ACT domain-containing protein [Gemmatimonadaceae bacterium]